MGMFLSAESTRAILEDGIAPWVVDHSPFEGQGLRRQMFIEYTNVDMFFAPIEIACWDIVGKALEKPIYELLGGWTAPTQTSRMGAPDHTSASEVPVAYCVGILSPEESRQHARRALEAGHPVLKTKAGRDWKQDVERIVAMDDEVDGQLDFRLDPNQGWRFDEAVRVGASLADRGVYVQYLEQPIRVDAHGTLVKLRERKAQPIGPNDVTYIEHNLQEMIRRSALDVAVLDMTPAGGITAVHNSQVSRRTLACRRHTTVRSTSGCAPQPSSTPSAAFPDLRFHRIRRTTRGRTTSSPSHFPSTTAPSRSLTGRDSASKLTERRSRSSVFRWNRFRDAVAGLLDGKTPPLNPMCLTDEAAEYVCDRVVAIVDVA